MSCSASCAPPAPQPGSLAALGFHGAVCYGLSNCAIADVLGVERETINRNVRGGNAPQEEAAPEEGENENGANAPHNDEPQKRQCSMPVCPAATTWLCCLMALITSSGTSPKEWSF
jgi:hypothetical protein